MRIHLQRSWRRDKKFAVLVDKQTIHFGAAGMSDYTIHKDLARKRRYIARHKPNENWTKSGINTPGFWSRWLLWNLPSLADSIADTERRFNITISK